MEYQDTHTSTPHAPESTPDLLRALTDLGGAWAGYGLGVARLYCETLAGSFSATARALSVVAQSLEAAKSPEPREPGSARNC